MHVLASSKLPKKTASIRGTIVVDWNRSKFGKYFFKLRKFTWVCAVLLFWGANIFAQRNPLDDTAAFINLSPGNISAFTCEGFDVNIQMTATNARVFDLRFIHDSDNFALTGVTPGGLASMHVLPHYVGGDTIAIDGFFHPNFTGTTLVATLHFVPIDVVGDQTTLVGFLDGQGFSGTGEAPEPMVITGDSSSVSLEGTPPLPPDSLVIVPMMDDSVCLHWSPVTLDEDNDPVVNPGYLVEFEDVINNQGVYDSIGFTLDTFFYHDFIIYEFDPGDTGVVNLGTYRIRALKCQN